MAKVMFFGLGAVASVMATAWYELCEKYGLDKPTFIFIVRNKTKAIEYLWKSLKVLERSVFVEISDFNNLEAEILKNKDAFIGVDLCINASLPDFNAPIQRISLAIGSHYCDLASDMYNNETLEKLSFLQFQYYDDFRARGVFSLINIGVSPGLTNFLVGEKILAWQRLSPAVDIRSIDIFLLEDIVSEKILFSWSPKVAIEELKQHPRYLEKGRLSSIEPFSQSQEYQFLFRNILTTEYPIFQEEVLSLHNSFPNIPNIKIYTGGGEVEIIKTLYQLNLLSEARVDCAGNEASLTKILDSILPGILSPKQVHEIVMQKLIKHAQFAASIEIVLGISEKSFGGTEELIVEKLGIYFNDYIQLKDTNYAGSTYISYPTGVSAAVLLFHTYLSWLNSNHKIVGVITSEAIPALLNPDSVENIKKDLVSYRLIFTSELSKK
jgi:saccharopine dehydrogenase-like NADP-dependent oxidoreductase